MTRLYGLTSVFMFLVCATPAVAQKNTLGLNLRISGAPDIGVTWFLSPTVAIRPAIAANSSTITGQFGGDFTVTQVALTTDVLFNARATERVRTYLGLGATIASLSSDNVPDETRWGVRTLFGIRVTVIERVAVFGEAAFAYFHSNDGEQSMGLSTLPIGIVVFLK